MIFIKVISEGYETTFPMKNKLNNLLMVLWGTRAPEAGGSGSSCPRCPDGTGVALGQEVPFSKQTCLVYPLHLKHRRRREGG